MTFTWLSTLTHRLESPMEDTNLRFEVATLHYILLAAFFSHIDDVPRLPHLLPGHTSSTLQSSQFQSYMPNSLYNVAPQISAALNSLSTDPSCHPPPQVLDCVPAI
jgi:hypothetical protein